MRAQAEGVADQKPPSAPPGNAPVPQTGAGGAEAPGEISGLSFVTGV